MMIQWRQIRLLLSNLMATQMNRVCTRFGVIWHDAIMSHSVFSLPFSDASFDIQCLFFYSSSFLPRKSREFHVQLRFKNNTVHIAFMSVSSLHMQRAVHPLRLQCNFIERRFSEEEKKPHTEWMIGMFFFYAILFWLVIFFSSLFHGIKRFLDTMMYYHFPHSNKSLTNFIFWISK